jgi:hypothetical protein
MLLIFEIIQYIKGNDVIFKIINVLMSWVSLILEITYHS